MLIVDGHCDTLLRCYNEKISFFDDHSNLHLSFKKMVQANIGLQYFALFIESKYKPFYALEQALKLISFTKKHLLSHQALHLVERQSDLDNFTKKKLVVLAIEGGEAINESEELLDTLFDLGVRSIGLTWNERNAIANGCLDTNLGLSKFGKNIVKKMQNIGMVVDCAHIAERGLMDVLEISSKPIIISHANCSSLYSHPRNISDDNLRLLAQNGGVIGITFVPQFLAGAEVKIGHIINHIERAVEVAGIESVALGSDFDGCDTLPMDINNAADYLLIIEALEKKGYKQSEISKLTHQNHLRILKNNLPK